MGAEGSSEKLTSTLGRSYPSAARATKIPATKGYPSAAKAWRSPVEAMDDHFRTLLPDLITTQIVGGLRLHEIEERLAPASSLIKEAERLAAPTSSLIKEAERLAAPISSLIKEAERLAAPTVVASISLSFRTNRPEHPAVKRIEREVRDRLSKKVDYGSGDESVHAGGSQPPWLEAYIDDSNGPFAPDLILVLTEAMVEARGEESLELFLRISGTGPKYRLPDEVAEAEAAFWSFQWDDETGGS